MTRASVLRATPMPATKRPSNSLESKALKSSPLNTNIIHARQLITVRGPSRARRGAELGELGIIDDGAVAIRDGRIEWVGPTDQLPDRSAPEFDAAGKIILPGFVDSHTHAVFARSRPDEFEWRIQGTPYIEIL